MQRPGQQTEFYHPIDHGWAWMICLGACVSNFFVNGGTRSLGILLVELIIQFRSEASIAAIALGVAAAGFAIFAALGNGYGVVFTNRFVAVVGGVFLFLAMIITAYAPNIIVVIIFLGGFSGIGYGFLFGPSMVSVGQYFEKRRSLANGLAVAGGSIGQLVLPMFLNAVINEYGYQGALLIYSGLILNAIPGALLLRPPSFYNNSRKAREARRALALKEVEEQKNNNEQQEQEKSSLLDEEDHVIERKAIHGSTKSLENLPHQEPPDMDEVSVADAETQATPQPKIGLCGLCCIILRKLFDKSLLTNPMFLCVAFGVSIGHGGYLDILFLIPAYCLELFGSKQVGAFILSVMGIADFAGRILGGWFSDLNLISRPSIIGGSFIICGILSILLPFFSGTKGMFIAFSVVFGLIGGTYMALLAVIVVDLFGLAMLPVGMGLSTMIMGLSIIPMPTIMGIIRKATGTVSTPIRVCGVMMLIGGMLYYAITYMRFKKERAERKLKRAPVEKVDAEVQVKPSDFFDSAEKYRLSLAEKESHI